MALRMIRYQTKETQIKQGIYTLAATPNDIMNFFETIRSLSNEKIQTFLNLHGMNCDSDDSDDGKSDLDEEYHSNKPPPILDDQLFANSVHPNGLGMYRNDIQADLENNVQWNEENPRKTWFSFNSVDSFEETSEIPFSHPKRANKPTRKSKSSAKGDIKIFNSYAVLLDEESDSNSFVEEEKGEIATDITVGAIKDNNPQLFSDTKFLNYKHLKNVGVQINNLKMECSIGDEVNIIENNWFLNGVENPFTEQYEAPFLLPKRSSKVIDNSKLPADVKTFNSFSLLQDDENCDDNVAEERKQFRTNTVKMQMSSEKFQVNENVKKDEKNFRIVKRKELGKENQNNKIKRNNKTSCIKERKEVSSVINTASRVYLSTIQRGASEEHKIQFSTNSKNENNLKLEVNTKMQWNEENIMENFVDSFAFLQPKRRGKRGAVKATEIIQFYNSYSVLQSEENDNNQIVIEGQQYFA